MGISQRLSCRAPSANLRLGEAPGEKIGMRGGVICYWTCPVTAWLVRARAEPLKPFDAHGTPTHD